MQLIEIDRVTNREEDGKEKIRKEENRNCPAGELKQLKSASCSVAIVCIERETADERLPRNTGGKQPKSVAEISETAVETGRETVEERAAP